MVVFCLGGIYFHYIQNKKNVIGGKISKAKTVWLFWALFYYYNLSLWIYFSLPDSILTGILVVCIYVLVLRAAIQPILMYIFKKWTPFYGMTFNVLLAMYVIYQLISLHINEYDHTLLILQSYLAILSIALLTDTYYAYKFHQIIGQGTQGLNAIWYASSDDRRFNHLNKTTSYFNFGFLCCTFALIYQIIFF